MSSHIKAFASPSRTLLRTSVPATPAFPLQAISEIDTTGRAASARGSLASIPAVAAGAAAAACLRSKAKKASRRARGGELKPDVSNVDVNSLMTEDQWIATLDLEGFGREVHDLGKRMEQEQGPNDQEHLEKIVMWSDVLAAIGLTSMWLSPNPITVIALSLWTHSRWTMIGHHASHGGYNHTDESGRYSSGGFAVGSLQKRISDWFDWILPEAWGIEHNKLHHYRLGEEADPDLLERNVSQWKEKKGLLTFVSMLIWKWAYYAPNTYKELKVQKMRQQGQPLPVGFDASASLTLAGILEGKGKGVVELGDLVWNVMGPYFLVHFFLLPLPLALLDSSFYVNGVLNLVLADLLSNFHAFCIIATNHCGEDLYRFEKGCKPKSPTFFLRAVVSSTNFPTGGDVNDFMHGWLNYQIEHHVWPNLSMLSYQKAQPELKAICEKYGVPYVQEDVFTRVRKTVDIMLQKTKMRRYPVELERESDLKIWNYEKTAAKLARTSAS